MLPACVLSGTYMPLMDAEGQLPSCLSSAELLLCSNQPRSLAREFSLHMQDHVQKKIL